MSSPSLHYARLAGDVNIERAHDLAREIEVLLTSAAERHPRDVDEGTLYAIRLSQAMARNLIDQLAEIGRPSSCSRPLAAPSSPRL